MSGLVLLFGFFALAAPLILALALVALALAGWIVFGLITLAGGLLTFLVSLGGPLALLHRLKQA